MLEVKGFVHGFGAAICLVLPVMAFSETRFIAVEVYWDRGDGNITYVNSKLKILQGDKVLDEYSAPDGKLNIECARNNSIMAEPLDHDYTTRTLPCDSELVKIQLSKTRYAMSSIEQVRSLRHSAPFPAQGLEGIDQMLSAYEARDYRSAASLADSLANDSSVPPQLAAALRDASRELGTLALVQLRPELAENHCVSNDSCTERELFDALLSPQTGELTPRGVEALRALQRQQGIAPTEAWNTDTFDALGNLDRPVSPFEGFRPSEGVLPSPSNTYDD